MKSLITVFSSPALGPTAFARSRSIFTAVVVFAALTLFLDTTSSSARAQTQSDSVHIAFRNVNVVPMDAERVLHAQTVLIQGHRIVALGDAAHIAIPSGSLEIDGTGKFLIPGLGEMHGYNPSPDSPEGAVERVYFLYVANGVTTVRSMLGWTGQLELREAVNRGVLFGPSLYLAGPSFSGGTVTSPGQAARRRKRE